MATIINFKEPQSSFNSVEKDLMILTDRMLKNNRLKKLLFYTTSDAMKRPNLTQEQTNSLLKKYIKTVPKLYIDREVLTYIIISFDNFTPSENPQFRDNVIAFDIICHYDQWDLNDFQLRPYKIAAEIDSMFNNQHLTGIGTLQFMGANQIILTDEFAGLTIMYAAVHGGEDKNYNKDQRDLLSPEDEAQFIKDFNELNDQD